jgi:hypothetical protein
MNFINQQIIDNLAEWGIPSTTAAVMNSYGNFLFESGCDCIEPFCGNSDGIVFGIKARLSNCHYEISCLKRVGSDMFLLKAEKSAGYESWSYKVIIGAQLLHIQQLLVKSGGIFA